MVQCMFCKSPLQVKVEMDGVIVHQRAWCPSCKVYGYDVPRKIKMPGGLVLPKQ